MSSTQTCRARSVSIMLAWLVHLHTPSKLVQTCDNCNVISIKFWLNCSSLITINVISVAWEGEGKNKVVMTGEGTDAATVTRRLRKKLCYAYLVSVEQVKWNKDMQNPTPCSIIFMLLFCCGFLICWYDFIDLLLVKEDIKCVWKLKIQDSNIIDRFFHYRNHP